MVRPEEEGQLTELEELAWETTVTDMLLVVVDWEETGSQEYLLAADAVLALAVEGSD